MALAPRMLAYVVLLCTDVARMKRFYHDVLGLPIRQEQEGRAVLEAGAVLLTLRPRGRSYDGAAPGTGTAAVQLAFRVPPGDVDRVHAALVLARMPVFDPPTSHDDGNRTVYFADPEGNIVEFFADN